MLPPLPNLSDYDVSTYNGFLPDELPLQILPDPYYRKWEAVVANLQALLLSKRVREVIQDLPVITTSRLRSQPEWRRAFVLLSFMTHAYMWGGDKPEERIPPSISIPFTQVCAHLELPTVATYAGVCLWNWKPIFEDEPNDSLGNLSTLATFTGSLDESWFYVVSVAMEARGGPSINIMLNAIRAARDNDIHTVTDCLCTLAEILDQLGSLLERMYDNCDPHVFYHRIRPFLAGSKNMADAGLPNGVLFDTNSPATDRYCQYGGGSNAQSSLIQFFDIILGIEHRPTGVKPPSSASEHSSSDAEGPSAPRSRHNFIHDMRSYMPGPHRRFLAHVSSVANIREFVEANRSDRPLTIAFDACLAMLRALRDKHIQMVSRYIIVKSRESRTNARSLSPTAAPNTRPAEPTTKPKPLNLASSSRDKKKLRGTGGTALIPFLKQARDETGEPAIDTWARRIMSNGPVPEHEPRKAFPMAPFANLGKLSEDADGEQKIVGLAGVWKMDDSEGGLCHW